MKITATPIPDLLALSPRHFTDDRGYFCELWNQQTLAQNGIEVNFVQENQSFNKSVGTIRGLHCQVPPHAQTKLVRCSTGRIFDVAVDVRIGSPAYGKWFGIELSAANGYQLIVPTGFLHGFVTREPDTEVIYSCTDYYAANSEDAVHFADSEIGIDWGLSAGLAKVSAKDDQARGFSSFVSPFYYKDSK
ncbi:MAG: dTDP-4-dehydrorhamnose 3,5-epimerase [Gammaproteobacteria bacterium]|nr:dTDP-4-dehydrorhamnose 3,5-epimerase [Gammaproteobacteria bacterium]